MIALFIYQFSDAQFYAGADGALVMPFKNLASEIDYGYGPSVNFGYSFKKSFDVSLNYQVLFFGPLRPNFHISSESLVLKYKIVNLKKCVPYFGFRTESFILLQKSLLWSREMPWNSERKKKVHLEWHLYWGF